MSKRTIITTIVAAFIIIILSVIYVVQTPDSKPEPKPELKPQPETEIGKMIGESIQNNPQNWYLKSKDLNDIGYYSFTLLDTTCLIEVSVSTWYGSGYRFTGDITKHTPSKTFSEKDKEFFKKYTNQIIEYSTFGLNHEHSVSLTEKDCEYILYQYENIILPIISAKRKKEMLQEQQAHKHRQDSLTPIMIKELKGCL